MHNLLFAPDPIASVAIAGSEKRFAVRRIHCVGQNYAAHAREMGSNPDREEPFFFSKPADAVCDKGSKVPYPPLTSNFHHEIELVVAIGKEGSEIKPSDAHEHIFGYGVGIDLTRRDLQAEAKKKGHPWDWGKGCDMGAPCAALVKADQCPDLSNASIWLKVNGEIRQSSNLSDLIWPIADIVAFCSTSSALKPGDLIYTGTPEGVSAVERGDKIIGGIDGLGEIEITIV